MTRKSLRHALAKAFGIDIFADPHAGLRIDIHLIPSGNHDEPHTVRTVKARDLAKVIDQHAKDLARAEVCGMQQKIDRCETENFRQWQRIQELEAQMSTNETTAAAEGDPFTGPTPPPTWQARMDEWSANTSLELTTIAERLAAIEQHADETAKKLNNTIGVLGAGIERNDLDIAALKRRHRKLKRHLIKRVNRHHAWTRSIGKGQADLLNRIDEVNEETRKQMADALAMLRNDLEARPQPAGEVVTDEMVKAYWEAYTPIKDSLIPTSRVHSGLTAALAVAGKGGGV